MAGVSLRGHYDPEDGPSLSLVLLASAVAVAVLFPLIWLVVRALEVGPARATGLLLRARTVDIVLNSVGLVATVTAASVLLGVPLAVLTVGTDLPLRRAWSVLVALPLVVPSYVGAFAFVSATGESGALSLLLEPLGVTGLPTIEGFGGAALVLTLYTYPYVFITTRAALLSFDGTLVEAARTLNHGRWAAFRRVTFPQIAPGVAAGALLVALYALADFGTPAIMRFDVFTRIIYNEYNAFGRDFAALLSLQLLAVVAVILALESRVGGADDRSYVGGATRTRLRLGRWRYPATAFCLAVVVLSLALPLGVLLLWLVRDVAGSTAGGFTFRWVFGLNSVFVSALAAGVAVVAAVPVAYLSARASGPLARLVDRATYVGYAVPGVVVGLALVSFGVRFATPLYQTLPLLVFAYLVRFLPQAVGAVRSSVLQVDPTLTEAARSLGRTPGGAFRSVTLPLIAPGVAAGAALVFLTTMKELPATLMLAPLGFETLVTYVWQVQEAGYYGAAAVPALVLVGISALSMVVILAQERR
ncbi:MAG: ABC transporter permease [Halobacteriaceae archaeon]